MGAVLSAQSVAVWWAVVSVAVAVTVLAVVTGRGLRRRSKDYPPADGLDNEERPR